MKRTIILFLFIGICYSQENQLLVKGSLPDIIEPGNLVATGVSDTEIEITWTDGGSGYQGTELQYSLDDETYTILDTIEYGTETYTHSGLTHPSTYYYKARHFKGFAKSNFTDSDSGSTFSSVPAVNIIFSHDMEDEDEGSTGGSTGSGTNSGTADSDPVNNGSWSWNLTTTAGSRYYDCELKPDPYFTSGVFYARIYVYINTMPDDQFMIMLFRRSANRANIRLNADGTLGLYNSNTQIGSNSSVLNTGQWYYIELKQSLDSPYEIEGKLNGVSFASGTGGSTSIEDFTWGIRNTAVTTDINFDDVAVSDEDWIGDYIP